jgi:hypothetical protein
LATCDNRQDHQEKSSRKIMGNEARWISFYVFKSRPLLGFAIRSNKKPRYNGLKCASQRGKIVMAPV